MTEQLNVQQMAERLCAADNILVLCHKNPDGDTIGCGSALCHALKALGKTAAVLCSDAVPSRYSFTAPVPFRGEFEPKTVVAVDVAPQPAPTAPLPALPIPAPAAYQATDATAVLAPPRKSSKKLIAVLCALLATILVAALAFIVPNFTAVKAMLGFQPTNPLVVTFDAINSLSTLRSTKYELRTHSSTDDSLDARMSGMYSLGQNHQ